MRETSEWSIAEVALEVGFGEQSYFSKLFKIKYEVSPTEYREKGGEDVDEGVKMCHPFIRVCRVL